MKLLLFFSLVILFRYHQRFAANILDQNIGILLIANQKAEDYLTGYNVAVYCKYTGDVVYIPQQYCEPHAWWELTSIPVPKHQTLTHSSKGALYGVIKSLNKDK